MKKVTLLIVLSLIILNCAGEGPKGFFGRGVNIAMDPRTLGTQIDDSIMQQNLLARLVLTNKKHFLKIGVKVLDGRIFLTGKVDDPKEKLQVTKIAWETKGARSIKNDIKIKEEFNFKVSAKDTLITSQLRVAMIFDKEIKSSNYKIDTYKKKIYIYGIAYNEKERRKVINEAKGVLDVDGVIASILLVEDLSRQSN
jgi:osmotically-inducible protein OsmY